MKWRRIRGGVFEAQSRLVGRDYIISHIKCGWVVGTSHIKTMFVCKYKYQAIRVCETIDKDRIL
jgi:hypothetical protein